MNTTRYWLAFGDIHDDVSRMKDIPELDKASGILITGDITLAGGTPQALKVLEQVEERTPAIMAQIGNMDHGEITDLLESKGWNIHARGRELFPDVYVIGVGGSSFTPFGTPSEFPESHLSELMEQGFAEVQEAEAARYGSYTGKSAVILVAHTPPYASACDRLHTGTPAGSMAVRDFIEKHQPTLCLCGHIHESRAEEYIGATHVINPGMLGAGGYVIVYNDTLDKRKIRAELKVLA